MFSKPKDKNQAGKGSIPRFNPDKQYKENYDKIFRKKKSQMVEYIYVDSDYWVSTYEYWNEE